jgi:hypothetical protein
MDRLQSTPGVSVQRLEQASLPAAISHGRRIAEGSFFCFLDDDDILLPNSLALRLKAIEDTQADVVVATGIGTNGQVVPFDPGAISADALGGFLKRNWLFSCGGLFRAANVPCEIFSDGFKYYEWSTIALRLIAAGKKITFIPDVTFQLFDTPRSESKTTNLESLTSELNLMRYALSVVTKTAHRKLVHRMMSMTHHSISEYYLDRGQLSEAWSHHWRALGFGPRSILYTRHLIWAALRLNNRIPVPPAAAGKH